MTRIILSIAFLMIVIGCAPAAATQPATVPPTAIEVIEAVATAEPSPTAEQLSFVPATYRDEVGKFAFDYPAGWSAGPEQVIGSRGSQTLFLSPGSTAEVLAEGGSRVVLMRYDWDPKNDLAARLAQRKAAWEASGFVVLEESTRQMADGRAIVDLLMQTTDGTQVLYSLAVIGDQYLELSAEGNLQLGREILSTLDSID